MPPWDPLTRTLRSEGGTTVAIRVSNRRSTSSMPWPPRGLDPQDGEKTAPYSEGGARLVQKTQQGAKVGGGAGSQALQNGLWGKGVEGGPVQHGVEWDQRLEAGEPVFR